MADYLCLTDLLDQDLTAYEYFQSLPNEAKRAMETLEPVSFADLQRAVKQWQQSHTESL